MADIITHQPPPDDPTKRPPPGTTIARVGDRYRLTYGFVERYLKRYGWHVRRKQMPTEIRDRLQGPRYGKGVNAKSDYLLEHVAQLDSMTADERRLHGGFCAIADAFGFPHPPRPVFPDDPPPPLKPGKGKGEGKPEKKDQPQPDKGDGEGEEQEDGEGDGDQKPDEGDGQPSDGDGDAGDQDPQDGDGEGDGKPDDQDGDGKPDKGDDGEGEEKDGPQEGGGCKTTDPEDDPLIERPDYGEAEDVFHDGGSDDATPTVQPDLGNLQFITPPAPIRAMPHPIPRIPLQHTTRERHRIEVSGFNALLAALREELLSVSRHKRTYDKDTGDLDFRKITDLATGQNLDRIFYRTTHAERLNTAVQLFVDYSGSMCYDSNRNQGIHTAGHDEDGTQKLTRGKHATSTRIDAANALSLVLAELFEKLRIPCEVLAFSTSVKVVKAWNERVVDSPIGRVGLHDATNLLYAMESGLQSLLPRRENRLIQAIITDGDIDPYEASRIKELLGRDRRLETYGFLIDQPMQHDCFLRTVDSLTPANMVEKILSTLGHVVAGGQHGRR
jgi:hypothetical protein